MTSEEILRLERDAARENANRLVLILAGIYQLLYPRPVGMPDGKTMVFRPQGVDTNEWLQMLSDRIRSIPDEIDAARAEAD